MWSSEVKLLFFVFEHCIVCCIVQDDVHSGSCWYLRFEFLSTVTMKNSTFWHMTPSSLVEIYRIFGRSYCLCRAFGWGHWFLPKYLSISLRIHDFVCQMTVFCVCVCVCLYTHTHTHTHVNVSLFSNCITSIHP